MSVSIGIDNVVKKYGDTTIIPDLSAFIKNGEFFTLLGPSGCGKTTLLRMIAGFNSIEGGTIKFDDKVINDIPAQKRNIGMVFQSYAIFPHLTVRQNVEYGLKIRKVPKEHMKERVDEILKVVKIDEYQDRLPERLSGGQQQRVALARAIVIHPQVLLMDEPLSNLDAKLRIEMRSAIRDVQKQVGITTVYVTHDQEEAPCHIRQDCGHEAGDYPADWKPPGHLCKALQCICIHLYRPFQSLFRNHKKAGERALRCV